MDAEIRKAGDAQDPSGRRSAEITVLNLAVSALAADLEPGAGELLWISDVYVFLMAGLLLPMGAPSRTASGGGGCC